MISTNRLAALFATTAIGALMTGHSAMAQTAPLPPEHYTMDPRGVDLVSGGFPLAVTEVSIGQPGNGLSYGRVLLANLWRDLGVGGMTCVSGVSCTVAVEGVSEVFDETSPGVWTPQEDTGSTLVLSGGVHVYTRAGGTAWRISRIGVARYGFDLAVAQKDEPNGLQTEYNYTTATYCAQYDPEGNCSDWETVAKIRSYDTSTGYQIHYDYVNETDPTDGYYFVVAKVTGINTAVDYCYQLATSCTGLTRVWPSVAYSVTPTGGGQIDIATDQSGRATQYEFISGGGNPYLKDITLPGMSTPQVELTWDLASSNTRVSQVIGASGQWDYTFADSGTTRTTTVAGPLGQGLTVVSDLTIGRAASVTDALSNTWTYQYNSGQRLERVTNPEGDYTQFAYDSRGNVTQTTQVPKSGSGLSSIVTSAAYPSTCANVVTCNSPTTTTDARGAVTDYTWDATHGGLLTVTPPAPTGGADRPQTRMSYGSFYAYVKNASGSIVPWATPVILPTEVSACATGASCANAANEVRTTLTYGSTGVANNRHPVTVARGSGTSPSMSVTAVTYTPDGDVETVDGPLSGTDDTTRYRYDNARQPVGVVGPDPDGGGALLNRAQRLTRNSRGLVTEAETGTTAGQGDSAWAAFNPLLAAETDYDALSRPVATRQQTGAGATVGVQQVSYDASGRPDCTVVRMNPATFGSLPAACTAATVGADGPDRITQTTYDAVSRPLTTTSAYGLSEAATESVTYTANGQPQTLTDGNDNVSTIVHDGFDRTAELRYPNASGGGSSTTDKDVYAYDAASNVTGFTTRGGQVFTLSYDALNRVTTQDAPSGTDDVTMVYDNLGRATSIAYPGGQTIVPAWDALSRKTSETTALGVVSSQYDAAGRRTRLTWPDALYVTYEYDLYGGLTAVKNNGGVNLQTFSYDNLGARTGTSRVNGVTSAWGYDTAGRMTSLSHNPAGTGEDVTFGYGWNPAGQIVSRTVSNPAYVHAPVTGSTSYTNDGKNRVTAAGGVSVGYDGSGNITSLDGVTRGYNARNQLTASGSATFQFDPAGRLNRATGAQDTRFLYDGQQVIGEANASGTLTDHAVPGVGVTETLVTNAAGAGVWLLDDERGSVVGRTTSGGAASVNAYDEYGMPDSANGGRFQYTGQMWLPDAGLYHYRARTYAPQIGRFMQTDPIGYRAGANLYAYVGADPVNLTDPLGLQATDLPPVVVSGVRCPSTIGHLERIAGDLVCVRNVTTPPPTNREAPPTSEGTGTPPTPEALERACAVAGAERAQLQRNFRGLTSSVAGGPRWNSLLDLHDRLREIEGRIDVLEGIFALASGYGSVTTVVAGANAMGVDGGQYSGRGAAGRASGPRGGLYGASVAASAHAAIQRNEGYRAAIQARINELLICGSGS